MIVIHIKKLEVVSYAIKDGKWSYRAPNRSLRCTGSVHISVATSFLNAYGQANAIVTN